MSVNDIFVFVLIIGPFLLCWYFQFVRWFLVFQIADQIYTTKLGYQYQQKKPRVCTGPQGASVWQL